MQMDDDRDLPRTTKPQRSPDEQEIEWRLVLLTLDDIDLTTRDERLGKPRRLPHERLYRKRRPPEGVEHGPVARTAFGQRLVERHAMNDQPPVEPALPLRRRPGPELRDDMHRLAAAREQP